MGSEPVLEKPTVETATEAERVAKAVEGLSIPFIANTGQTDPKVAYYAQTFSGTVFVTKSGEVVYALPGKKEYPASKGHPDTNRYSSRSPLPPGGEGETAPEVAQPGWALSETFVKGKPQVKATNPSQVGVSYFVGNDRSKWASGVATFDAVDLGEVWPKVTVTLKAYGRNVEKRVTVLPGGSVTRYVCRYRGATV